MSADNYLAYLLMSTIYVYTIYVMRHYPIIFHVIDEQILIYRFFFFFGNN
jgi:hypothetical protein